MKIFLINTPKEGECLEFMTPSYLSYDFAHYPPLGLLAIAADVDPRHEIKVLDTITKDLSIQQTFDEIKKFQPDLVGIGVSSRRLYPMYSFTKKIKNELPEITVIVGGAHPNEFGMETMQLGTADYVMSGYCEKAFPQFVEALDSIKNKNGNPETLLPEVPGLYYREGGEIKFNPEDEKGYSLDDHPFPKRELLNLNDYFTAADNEKMTTMYTSRGCPYKCTFCDVTEKKYHYRSTKGIVDEMEYILSLNIKEIHIFDDTFNLNRRRVMDMCNEILRRNLKVRWTARVRANPMDREMLTLMMKAGCCRLHAGIESLAPLALEKMRKQITLDHIRDFFALTKELKIDVLAYLILGFPEETQEYRDSFYKIIKKMDPAYIYLNLLYPVAKTELYDNLVRDGFYEKDYWAEFFANPTPGFVLPPCRPKTLHRELDILMNDVLKKFYLSPKFIMKDLARNRSPKMLLKKSKIALKLMLFDNSHTTQAP